MKTLNEYWVLPSARYTIEGAKSGSCPSSIEVHSFSTSTAPGMIRTVVRLEEETAASIWQRALEVMLEFKRTLPLNVSSLTHGMFQFRYGDMLNAREVEANISYRNRRFQASWAARYGDTSAKQTGRAMLEGMVDSTAGPSLERVLANLELALLNRMLSPVELHPLLEWAEKQRFATPLNDSAAQDAIGATLARYALALLEAKAPPVATLQ